MTKNQPISDEVKDAIRVEVKQARKDGEPTLASIAAKYHIHPTMISKIAPNGVKAPRVKRRTAKVASKPQAVSIDALLKEYKQTLSKAVSIRKQIDNEIERAVNS